MWAHLPAIGNHCWVAVECALVSATDAGPLPDIVSYDLAVYLIPAPSDTHSLGGKPKALKEQTDLIVGGAGAVDRSIELPKRVGTRVVTTFCSDEEQVPAEAGGVEMAVVRYMDYTAS
ncbi:hypothetical protein L612_003800000050 [Rhodococcus rhodochrous J38]|nr:hypothetical protein L612_003800000050 [Rhodococcus rhodochrous J38]